MHDYNRDEELIEEAILHARHVQDYIWGHTDERLEDKEFNISEWRRYFQKRVDCISRVDLSHPSARVELRKRVLQQAALSIRALTLLDTGSELIQGNEVDDDPYEDDPILRRIHEILWNDWNPLRCEGLPEDEYLTYEQEVRTLLLYGGSVAAIAFRLYIAEYGMFHSEVETQAELKKKYVPTDYYDRLMEVARRVVNRARRKEDE